MAYDERFVRAALPMTFFDAMTVQQEKEAGMPGGTVDPRKSVDPMVSIIDVRIAWERCYWLTRDERQAMLALGMFGKADLASIYTDVPPGELKKREARGVVALTDWLNSTHLQRAQLESELSLDFDSV